MPSELDHELRAVPDVASRQFPHGFLMMTFDMNRPTPAP